ncbi:hypothetical protein AX16_008676 [Volvariella volvacea WC 439]|nr:hypothetical protein AX16_008676 [Volvariella volvacea WC 439]
MPSVPRPVFYPPNSVSRGPAPRPRDPVGPTLDIPFVNCAADSAPSSGGDLSPVSPRSQGGTPRTVRGPWDHSGSIKVALDVEQLLTPLKPVAHA